MRRFYAVLACVLTGRIFSVSLLLHVCKQAVHSPFSLYIDKVLACETTLYTRKFPYFYCINTGKSSSRKRIKQALPSQDARLAVKIHPIKTTFLFCELSCYACKMIKRLVYRKKKRCVTTLKTAV